VLGYWLALRQSLVELGLHRAAHFIIGAEGAFEEI
jgi:hypothetical protein